MTIFSKLFCNYTVSTLLSKICFSNIRKHLLFTTIVCVHLDKNRDLLWCICEQNKFCFQNRPFFQNFLKLTTLLSNMCLSNIRRCLIFNTIACVLLDKNKHFLWYIDEQNAISCQNWQFLQNSFETIQLRICSPIFDFLASESA